MTGPEEKTHGEGLEPEEEQLDSPTRPEGDPADTPTNEEPVRPLDESWTAARRYTTQLKNVSALFSSCIRGILSKNSPLIKQEELLAKDNSLNQLEFLLRLSPTLRSVFYFAVHELSANAVDDSKLGSPHALARALPPQEAAAVLALTYLYRRIQSCCDPQEWQILSRRIQTQIAIGQAVGIHMRYIGRADGMLIGGIRYLACALFAAADLKTYQKIRRALKSSSKLFSTKLEKESFGCNHLQIASILLQWLGYCMPHSPGSMSLGMDSLDINADLLSSKAKEYLLSWRAAMALIESYHSSGGPPTRLNLDYALYLPQEEEATLRDRVWAVVRDDSGSIWVARQRSDVPSDVAQRLDIPQGKLSWQDESKELESWEG